MEDRSPLLTLVSLRVTWVIVALLFATQSSLAQTPEATLDSPWIWSPRGNAASETYFRKKFTLVKPEKAELIVAAGDEFELYINGQVVISGQSYRSAMSVDAMDFLNPGVNIIAVKANHIDSDQAGFSCKLRVKERGEIRHRVLRTDATWKSYTAQAVDWQKGSFRDMSWLSSKVVTSSGNNSVSNVTPDTEKTTTPNIEVTNRTASPKIDLVSRSTTSSTG